MHACFPIRRSSLLVAALLASSLTPAATRAQGASVTVGGFAVGSSRLALAKAEAIRGPWALVADVTRDGVRERWGARDGEPASRGDYVMWAASAGLRRYTRAGARGFFAELGAGAARARLDVRPEGGPVATRRATVPMAAWGAGGRMALGGTTSFVELGLRSAIPLATRHLHTDASAPAGSTREPVTYRSWYFGAGKPTSQLYAGIGITF